MDNTKIEWTDASWNPIDGCTPVSEGCQHCYAANIAKRFWCERKFSDVEFHRDRLEQPLRWKKSRKIFVCSMGDLFHGDVEIEGYAMKQILYTMMDAGQHTYIFLTKRPRNMRAALYHFFDGLRPPKNWWLGVTAENQKQADERIPILLKTPAAVRFVSVEPMLERVDLWQAVALHGGIDWVICGKETGPGARPMKAEWAIDLYEQCKSTGTSFFFKKGDVPDYVKVREFPARQ